MHQISKRRFQLLVASILAIALLAFSIWAGNKCTPEFIGNPATNCLEFWTNRYQSLIAAILALVAAFIATRVVRRQLAVQTYEMFQRRFENIERDYRLAWKCKREAKLAILFEQNMNELQHPTELVVWQTELANRISEMESLRVESDLNGTKDWDDRSVILIREEM